MELEKLLVKDKITVLCRAKKMSPKHYIKLYKQQKWTFKKCQANEFSKTTNYRLLACSKRSDSGERCEVKKAMKVEGDWGERCSSSLAFIFSRSFLLRTAPHYLNAWKRLIVFRFVHPCLLLYFLCYLYLFLSCFDRLFLVFAQFGSGFGLNFCNVRDAALLGVVSLDKRLFTLPLGV